ncbi:CUB domain-containing protein [Oryctes borbonicus]|uniref:CUB domain-containing protein n=1 Tax=Oryctes borbonicus TaxID=1629725 RepID=A0A0T6BAC5_9SCAR|nr:CUB domain-containing protein [Oryctes borbonicus]
MTGVLFVTASIPEKLPCQINMTGEQGFVNNSNIDEKILAFSRQYNMPVECLWMITVKEGWKIQLAFKKFSLSKPNECDKNFLDVFSTKTDLTHREKNFCGSIADTVTSKSNIMYIRFFATPVANASCFQALFTAYRENTKTECEKGEFNCDDTTCISITLKCNGQDNCRYRWDEDDCGQTCLSIRTDN